MGSRPLSPVDIHYIVESVACTSTYQYGVGFLLSNVQQLIGKPFLKYLFDKSNMLLSSLPNVSKDQLLDANVVSDSFAGPIYRWFCLDKRDPSN